MRAPSREGVSRGTNEYLVSDLLELGGGTAVPLIVQATPYGLRGADRRLVPYSTSEDALDEDSTRVGRSISVCVTRSNQRARIEDPTLKRRGRYGLESHCETVRDKCFVSMESSVPLPSASRILVIHSS